jgi:S-adenosylmethionine:tRNA ribosyltransferase-isomerase
VRWRAMARASKPIRVGTRIVSGPLVVEVEGTSDDGLYLVRLSSHDANIAVEDAIRRTARVPLPPYIKRPVRTEDEERYQTVYARAEGAVAAPTAGLHLTHALLKQLEGRGCEIIACTLHVGLGTFQPVTAADFDDHVMHSETFEVSSELAVAIARARERGAPVLAVGTTVVRALESAADPERDGHVIPRATETQILIQPGYRFRVVDRLLTNFHLPKSTLLALVSAFAGTDRVLSAYREAVERRYRFFSYGDAMLLSRSELA